MKVMNHTEEQQTENKTSLSNGAKRNRIFIYIAIAGVIAAVITAAFTGYSSSGACRREETGRIIKSREGKKAERKKS